MTVLRQIQVSSFYSRDWVKSFLERQKHYLRVILVMVPNTGLFRSYVFWSIVHETTEHPVSAQRCSLNTGNATRLEISLSSALFRWSPAGGVNAISAEVINFAKGSKVTCGVLFPYKAMCTTDAYFPHVPAGNCSKWIANQWGASMCVCVFFLSKNCLSEQDSIPSTHWGSRSVPNNLLKYIHLPSPALHPFPHCWLNLTAFGNLLQTDSQDGPPWQVPPTEAFNFCCFHNNAIMYCRFHVILSS